MGLLRGLRHWKVSAKNKAEAMEEEWSFRRRRKMKMRQRMGTIKKRIYIYICLFGICEAEFGESV